MIDSLQNPVILNLSGGLWRKHFCLLQHRFDPPPPLFGRVWFNALKVEGSQKSEFCAAWGLVPRLCLGSAALPGWPAAPRSGSEDLFMQSWLTQTNPKFNEVWVWSWKTSWCAPKQMKRAAPLAPSTCVPGAGTLSPSPDPFPPQSRLLPRCRLAARFTDLAGVQN